MVLNNSLLLSPTSNPFILSLQSSFSTSSGSAAPSPPKNLPGSSISVGGSGDQAKSLKEEAVKAARLLQDGSADLLVDFDGE